MYMWAWMTLLYKRQYTCTCTCSHKWYAQARSHNKEEGSAKLLVRIMQLQETYTQCFSHKPALGVNDSEKVNGNNVSSTDKVPLNVTV